MYAVQNYFTKFNHLLFTVFTLEFSKVVNMNIAHYGMKNKIRSMTRNIRKESVFRVKGYVAYYNIHPVAQIPF